MIDLVRGVVAKKGKWFENKSRGVLRDLFPSGILIHDEKRISTHWGGFRKVDIGIGEPGHFDYVIFECKDEKNVGPSAIDQAIEIKEDVGAKNAALLVNGRISENALKKAKSKSLEVFNVVDPDDNRLRPHLWAKVLTYFIWLRRFRYSLIFADVELKIYGDPNSVYIESDKTMAQLVKDKWNDESLNRKMGVHSYSWEKFHLISAPDLGIKFAAVDEIKIEYEVVEVCYLSKVDLSKGVGLYDVVNGKFISSSDFISFGPMTLEDVINKGERVENSEEIKGVALIGYFYHVE